MPWSPLVSVAHQFVRHMSSRRDSDESGRLLLGDEELGDSGVALADHADLAVAPRLVGQPVDDARAVSRLLWLEEVERAFRAAGAAHVDADVRVAAIAQDELI